MTPSVRINKFIAHATGISRREADDAVEHGRVTVDGTTATAGARVSQGATVTLDGQPLNAPSQYQYLLLNKPVGYVCSRRRQGDTPTIYELLPPELRPLKPVGRLDKDSSGLILLTNDGDFAHRMTHPSFHKTKIYQVELDHRLEPLHQQMISDHGVTLEDGVSRFVVAKSGRAEERKSEENHQDKNLEPRTLNLERSGGSGENETSKNGYRAYEVTMHEGRNRQIRRTFTALGYTVTRLHRTTFGPYSLGDITPGTWQIVNMR